MMCIIKCNKGFKDNGAPALQQYEAQRVKSLSVRYRRAAGGGRLVCSRPAG